LAKALVLHVNGRTAILLKDMISHFRKLFQNGKLSVPGLFESVLLVGSTNRLMLLLQRTMATICSDPRDKVYAIVSLLNPTIRDLVRID